MPVINLEDLDIKSLKELAYNFIAQKEDLERSEAFRQHMEVLKNLQLVNYEINIRARIEAARNKGEGNHIPASNHNSLSNSTGGNKLIT